MLLCCLCLQKAIEIAANAHPAIAAHATKNQATIILSHLGNSFGGTTGSGCNMGGCGFAASSSNTASSRSPFPAVTFNSGTM